MLKHEALNAARVVVEAMHAFANYKINFAIIACLAAIKASLPSYDFITQLLTIISTIMMIVVAVFTVVKLTVDIKKTRAEHRKIEEEKGE